MGLQRPWGLISPPHSFFDVLLNYWIADLSSTSIRQQFIVKNCFLMGKTQKRRHRAVLRAKMIAEEPQQEALRVRNNNNITQTQTHCLGAPPLARTRALITEDVMVVKCLIGNEKTWFWTMWWWLCLGGVHLSRRDREQEREVLLRLQEKKGGTTKN